MHWRHHLTNSHQITSVRPVTDIIFKLVFGIARKYKKVLMRPGQITPNIECVVLLLKAGRDSFSEAFTQLGVIDSNDFENSKSYGDVYEAEMAMMKM